MGSLSGDKVMPVEAQSRAFGAPGKHPQPFTPARRAVQRWTGAGDKKARKTPTVIET